MSATTASSPDLADWLNESLGRGDLAPLAPDELEEFAGHLDAQDFAGGLAIYQRHALPSRVYILRSGAVELTRELNGRSVVVQLLRPGSVFGDIPLFLRSGEPTSARAIEDSTVLSIDSVTLFSLLGRRPMLARRWLASIAERMAAMQDRVSDLLAGTLDAQVASWALREAGIDGVSVSQQTLARLLGARRTSVNQALRRLERRGLVEIGYRRIRVTDEPGLHAVIVGG